MRNRTILGLALGIAPWITIPFAVAADRNIRLAGTAPESGATYFAEHDLKEGDPDGTSFVLRKVSQVGKPEGEIRIHARDLSWFYRSVTPQDLIVRDDGSALVLARVAREDTKKGWNAVIAITKEGKIERTFGDQGVSFLDTHGENPRFALAPHDGRMAIVEEQDETHLRVSTYLKDDLGLQRKKNFGPLVAEKGGTTQQGYLLIYRGPKNPTMGVAMLDNGQIAVMSGGVAAPNLFVVRNGGKEVRQLVTNFAAGPPAARRTAKEGDKQVKALGYAVKTDPKGERFLFDQYFLMEGIKIDPEEEGLARIRGERVATAPKPRTWIEVESYVYDDNLRFVERLKDVVSPVLDDPTELVVRPLSDHDPLLEGSKLFFAKGYQGSKKAPLFIALHPVFRGADVESVCLDFVHAIQTLQSR